MLNSETPKNKEEKNPIKSHLNIVKEGHGFPSNGAPRDNSFSSEGLDPRWKPFTNQKYQGMRGKYPHPSKHREI